MVAIAIATSSGVTQRSVGLLPKTADLAALKRVRMTVSILRDALRPDAISGDCVRAPKRVHSLCQLYRCRGLAH